MKRPRFTDKERYPRGYASGADLARTFVRARRKRSRANVVPIRRKVAA